MMLFRSTKCILGFCVGVGAVALMPVASQGAVVFSDEFMQADGTAIGNGWTEAGSGGDVVINGGALRIIEDNDSTSGGSSTYVWRAASGFASPYDVVLSSNPGLVTWTLNIGTPDDPNGWSGGRLGPALVIGSTSDDLAGSGNGYVLQWGDQGNRNASILFSRFSGGVTSQTVVIGPSDSDPFDDISNVNLSVKLTFDPGSGLFSLYARDDGIAFADPAAGAYTLIGSAIDTTYTGVALENVGLYMRHNSAAGRSATFDNLTVSVIPEPASLALLGLGGLMLLPRHRRG